jgi:hypothetical protein
MKNLFLVALTIMSLGTCVSSAFAQVSQIEFSLEPQAKLLSCLGEGATAQVKVVRGSLNDTLTLTAHHLKPKLAFDLFTIQNTNLLANGQLDPAFKNFGLAWYQTDVQANSNGDATVTIKTILLDQIFGFDAATGLAPTHAFHVGIWFNNPQDAASCGFNPHVPTPFNGEQKAGPNAMISLPNSVTKLGPLCTSPSKSGSTYVCKE